MTARVILGRDGMGGDANEEDFEAWAAYVNNRIDAAAGVVCDVQERSARDVQSNWFGGDTDDERQAASDALQVLWVEFCEDDSAWPKRAKGGAS